MKFEIFKNKRNQKFYFNLKSRNGAVVLTSEGMPNKGAVKRCIASVQKNVNDEKWIEKKVTKSGIHTFSIVNSKNNVVGKSKKYNSMVTLNKGLRAVTRASGTDTIIDLTSSSN